MWATEGLVTRDQMESMGMLLQAGLETAELLYIWQQATVAGKIIILLLMLLSIFAWSVMASKTAQMRRARRLNHLFNEVFEAQGEVMEIYKNNSDVEGCPLFTVYQAGCHDLLNLLPEGAGEDSETGAHISLKSMEHVKRSLESEVAKESLKLESGLILLAITVSGAPFIGLLGTVWGVMSTFSNVAMTGQASMDAMAPGVSAALATTVAGLLVAIPSMFGYNWLVHTLRVFTVELDNFAQELVSQMEANYLRDEE